MKSFFISYHIADRSWAEWIAWQLEEAGYNIVLQAWNLRSGYDFVLEMQWAATIAERTIAVLSQEYLTALNPMPEWVAAFTQALRDDKSPLLPVRVRECNLRDLLPAMVYIDLVGLDEAAARDTLLAGVSHQRARPSAPPRFPVTLPSIWNVPHHRNPNFTGRDSLLADLRRALLSRQPVVLTQTQVASGLGGVGKTQLAVEYAYRYAGDYSIIWWVRAEEAATLAADYASLARAVGSIGPSPITEQDSTDQTASAAAVRRWLDQHFGWLLIFDQADNPLELQNYLPQGATGHVLITSRNPNWLSLGRRLSVLVPERDESVGLLLKRTGQTDRVAAEALAEALGDLPLALAQAGAYIEATGTSLSGYLELFHNHQQELLNRYPPSSDYPATVATTWEISLQRLQRESPAAAELLNLCAFLAPEAISPEMLRQGAEHLPQPLAALIQEPVALNDAVAALRRYSLIEVVDSTLSVHRLLQAVARHRLTEDVRRTWAEAALRLVSSSLQFDANDLRTWPQMARLLPHMLASSAQTEALGVVPEINSYLLNEAGLYLHGLGELATAREVLERALAITEAACGPNGPTVAVRVNNLAILLRDLGEFAEARAGVERALAIDQATYGANHPSVARDLNSLGNLLRDLGDLAGARTHLERALAVDEAAYGPGHPSVARDLNNLGNLLRDLGDLAGARGHLKRAIAINEAAYGSEHPSVARGLNNLGNLLHDLGDLTEARMGLDRALAIDEANYGPNHSSVARDLNSLGILLRDLGDLAGARAHLERALAIDQAAYGPDHPLAARDLNNLGNLLRDLGDLTGARTHLERALQIFRQFLGDTHPSTATVRNNLDSLLPNKPPPSAQGTLPPTHPEPQQGV